MKLHFLCAWAMLFCAILVPVGSLAASSLKIVLFGDSLIAGPYIPDEEKVHLQLQKLLKQYAVNAQVINAGVNGETTAGGVGRVEQVIKLKPDVVVVALGANDMLRTQDTAQTYSNLGKIIEQLLATKNIRVMLVGMMARPNHTQLYQQSFNAIYPTLAKQYGVEFFPFLLQDVALVPEMNLQDGLHPNNKGAAKIAENMTPYILRLLGFYERK